MTPAGPAAYYYSALQGSRAHVDALRDVGARLVSILDLTASGLEGDALLDVAVLTAMGGVQAAWAAVVVGGERRQIRRSRGRLPRHLPAVPDRPGLHVLAGGVGAVGAGPGSALLTGPRVGDRDYGEEEEAFLTAVASSLAPALERERALSERDELNRRLSIKVLQLDTLFEISRELSGSFDEEAIQTVVSGTLMGQLLVSRCALYLRREQKLELVLHRGTKGEAPPVADGADAAGLLAAVPATRSPGALPGGAVRDWLVANRMALLIPLALRTRECEGFLALGERLSGAPFAEEDREFAETLGRQVLAGLEGVRLHRLQLEKQRRDREMQIAREIQQSLFPRSWPAIPGFEVAAESRACYEVGGDHFDVIPLGHDRVALAVADVAGKGTPASLLMASVHASLRALAGEEPAVLATRLNRFLLDSTEAQRYVTLFYGELDARQRRLRYVNAGHVPPVVVRPDGRDVRLDIGGTALGLLETATYTTGEIDLPAGSVLAVVTDGVTEILSADGEEFGDLRVRDSVASRRPCGAGEVLSGLLCDLAGWMGPAGATDDQTALLLKATEDP